MAKKSGIHIKKSKQGSLHKAVGVKKGNKIPASKLKIKSTDSPALRKKKQFAINAKKWHHQTGGEVDEAGNLIDQYNTQNDITSGYGNGPLSQQSSPITPGASAQQNGLIDPGQQPYAMGRANTNSSVDLQQYLKTPQGAANAKKYKRMGYDITGFGPDGKPTFSKTTKVVTGPNQGVALFNGAASIATGIADVFHEKDQRADEYRKIAKNIAPKFMENMESEGLNNTPAYTMMGGPIAHGEPVGVVDFDSGGGLDDTMYEGFRHSGPYGQSMVYSGNIGKYSAGGHVSADKAKEILRDGTAQGHPLTDKQKRYFGWLAGGGKQYGGNMTSFQTGGQPAPAGPNPSPVNPPVDNSDPNADYYKANATLQYFKTQLNNKLREKDPKAYDQFQAGFADINNQYKSGKLPATQIIPTRQNYVQNSDYNVALSPDDVQGALGDQYQNYLNSLQTINKYNVAKGQQPLYGTIEGDQDITKLNYGRRFASVTTNPTSDTTLKKANGTLQRRRTSYTYDPTSNQVNSSQYELDDQGNPIQPAAGGSRQAGGYAVGQTVNLTTSQIKALKKQGYKIENA